MDTQAVRGFAAFALCVLLAGCAGSPRVDKHVWLPLGTTYTQQVSYSGSFSGPAEIAGKVAAVTYKGQAFVGLETAGGTLVSAPSGDYVAQLSRDGRPMVSWDPPIGFDWPLEVGRKWTRSFKFTNHAANTTLDIVANAVVEAYEDVTVPAGTFQAFRVRVTNNAGLEEMFWYSPAAQMIVKQNSTRTAASPQGPGTRESVLKSVSVARWTAYKAPPTGTTWTNQFRNSGSFTGPAEVNSRMGEMTWNGQPHIAFHNGASTLVARPDGTWITMLGGDGKPALSWEPATPLAWPLEVGKAWKSSFKVVNHANNNSVNVDADYTIDAYEDVTVPAGTFKAYRMRMVTNLGDDNTWWFAPENGLFVKQKLLRTDKHPAGAGMREVEMKALALAR